MPVNYPPTWIERVARAPKLTLAPDRPVYRSPDGRQEIGADVVTGRIEAYLRAETARRRCRRLTKDDERICRDYVLLLDNWRTGHWDRREPGQLPAKWAVRRPRRKAS